MVMEVALSKGFEMTTPAPAAPVMKKTALNAKHRALKAKIVDFGGWEMPVEYPGPGTRRAFPNRQSPLSSPSRRDVSHSKQSSSSPVRQELEWSFQILSTVLPP